MKRILSFLLASIPSLACTHLAHAEDYQKRADATAWSWSEERASVSDASLRFSKDYQVELIRPENKFGAVTIRVLDAAQEIYAWQGHDRSVFTRSGDMLIYADFHTGRSGCIVVAYDLKKQKQLWKTPLKGLGPIPHSRYANLVNLEVVNNEVVRVFGQESAGQYLEFVDLKTGMTVGHRVYGK